MSATRRQILEALATLAAAAAVWPSSVGVCASPASPTPAGSSTHAPDAPQATAPPPSRPTAAQPSPRDPARAARALSATSLVAAAATLDGASLLDDSLGEEFLDGLSSTVGKDALGRLVALVLSTPASDLDAALEKARLTQAARDVVASFYSGLVGAPGKEKMVTYLMALVWGAAPFTKPPSICGGMFGYWANPPASPPGVGAAGT